MQILSHKCFLEKTSNFKTKASDLLLCVCLACLFFEGIEIASAVFLVYNLCNFHYGVLKSGLLSLMQSECQ